MDLASLDLWDDCTAAEVAMFRETASTDKDEEVVGRPDPRIVGAAATLLEAGEDDTAPRP